VPLMAQVEIVSITHRQAPETSFPAASNGNDRAINTHRELVNAGVAAGLYMWDGLGHAFFYNIDLPECATRSRCRHSSSRSISTR
jgi:hypothetical protein